MMRILNKAKQTLKEANKVSLKSKNRQLGDKVLRNQVKKNTPPKNRTKVVKSPLDIEQKKIGRLFRGAKPEDGEKSFWRFLVVWGVMLLCSGSLFARAYYLQVANSAFFIEKGDEFITAKRKIPVSRGMITDTYGIPLAANAPLSTVVFSPQDYARAYYYAKKTLNTAQTDAAKQKATEKLQLLSLDRLADVANFPLEKLTEAVHIDEAVDVRDPKAILDALPTGAGSHRLVLMSRTTPEIAKGVMDLDFEGVYEEQFLRRYYLQGEENAQIIGFMSTNDKDSTYRGQSGIEAQYENTLSGTAGQVLVLKSASQHALKQLKELKPAVMGQDIALTIDSRLQYLLYKELERVGRDQSARWSSGMIVDIESGDVLAMGSWPSFNANNLAQRTGVSERNRPVLDVFEPGSVMKPFTVAAALESGKYTVNTLIDTAPGSMRVQGNSIRDSANYGKITLGKLIQKSSNVASAKIALSLPADSMAVMQHKFGFGQKTALNFPAEAAGKVGIPKENEMARRATLAYGYGQQVTLAQLAQAYATLGAKGQLHPLRLVKNEPIQPSHQVISAEHAEDIVAMMELVTMQGGTAKAAAIDGYRVAGKTGTSRRTSPQGGYAADEHRSIFVGIAPVSNPKFAIAILVEDPREQFYGGLVAAPVFGRVMGEALRIYNVPMDKPLLPSDK